ncbi:geranylgeranylglycerol-phosphate geranylgeranyltransferase [Nonlabens antarcticus]|uniref:geranylgeranylglycerol-phosphate geranylgeranyltransferase n=1 Tax=Nonlabens antarcticus TaxID=392714 RepID=UPI001891269E|nr:geranylgeranylglycerol-phosphate geranylgeranyltransferase [Nonlabens antarcticus]
MAIPTDLNLKKRSIRVLAIKVLSLFSTVRLYNVAIVALAQLMAVIFIIAPNKPILSTITDYRLWFIIIASAATIAGGYIINNFYDREKDLINRPQKTMLENQVKRSTLWSVYFFLNGMAFVLGMIVSWRAGLFYAVYITAMWFYSHKLKKVLFVGNLVAAALAVLPFFVLFMYYKNFYLVILVHGSFLFLIIGMRELIKDLENLRGDLAQNYNTLPVVLGEKMTKKFYTVLTVISIIPVVSLMVYFETGYMNYYFAFITGALLVCLPLLWSSRRKREYLLIHFILKIIIVAGVFSILLIDLPGIFNRINTMI